MKCPHFNFVGFPFDVQKCYVLWHSVPQVPIKINGSVVANSDFQNCHPDIPYAIDYIQLDDEEFNEFLPSMEKKDVSYTGIKIQLSRYAWPHMFQ